MAHELLCRCPNCGGGLEIARLECTRCETVILARFESCRFCSLPPQSLRFIEDFVHYRGNLKEMERVSGESYWTLRTRLGEVIEQMGYQEAETSSLEEASAKRKKVLDRLEAGELDAAEAAELLAALTSARGRA